MFVVHNYFIGTTIWLQTYSFDNNLESFMAKLGYTRLVTFNFIVLTTNYNEQLIVTNTCKPLLFVDYNLMFIRLAILIFLNN